MTLFCFGQKDHLEPAKDIFKNDSSEYYVNCNKLLSNGFSQKPDVRYTCMPSFSGEYAFSVEKVNGKNYVLSNRFSENYWYALVENKKSSLKVITNKVEITNELYLKIEELFGLFIEQTKEKERIFETLPDGTVVEMLETINDGERYIFSITDKNGNIKTGTTHSPNSRDRPMLDRFVKICDSLCLLENKNKESQTKILEEIKQLINGLKTRYTALSTCF